jgi:hypothetical protein
VIPGPTIPRAVNDAIAMFALLVVWPSCLALFVRSFFDFEGPGICEECAGLVDHSLDCSRRR